VVTISSVQDPQNRSFGSAARKYSGERGGFEIEYQQ
jgi:hypothetical protein